MEVGRIISTNKNLFYEGTNVEFAIILNRRHIMMRVYERGSGETQACGSGAASVFFVANETKKVDNYVTVSLLGGDLVCSRNELSQIIIDGEAELNYEGEIIEGDTLWQRLT